LTRKRPFNDPNSYAKETLAISKYNYNEDLGRIRSHALIIEGEQDLMTSLVDSARISRFMLGSKLVILKVCDYGSYIEQSKVLRKNHLTSLSRLASSWEDRLSVRQRGYSWRYIMGFILERSEMFNDWKKANLVLVGV
jgi:hypothetical protein